MSKLYYTAPSETVFDEIRVACLMIWSKYQEPTQLGYMREKFERVLKTKNIADNYMFLIAMFDMHNQALFAKQLTSSTLNMLIDALVEVDNNVAAAIFKQELLNRKSYGR